MKQLPALVFALFCAAATYSGFGCGGAGGGGSRPIPAVAELSGTVRDAVNSAPLAPATVTVSQNGGSHSTATDERGFYFVDSLAADQAHVTASAPGRQTYDTDIRLAPGRNTLNVELRRTP